MPKKDCLLLTGLLIVLLLLLVTVLLMDGLKAPKDNDDDDGDVDEEEDADVDEEEEGAMKSFKALSATTSTFCSTLSIPMYSKQINIIKAWDER